jgi:DNA-binding response OmpR family regulator
MDKKKILIVEDDALILDTLTRRFQQEGFYVTAVPDGTKALESALEGHPDVILLDIVIPEMDGMAVLDALRKDAWGAKVPIILLTNFSDSARVAEAVSYGVYDYLVKADWKIDGLVKKVKSYFPEGV